MHITQTYGMNGLFTTAKRSLIFLAVAGLLCCRSATATTYSWTNKTSGTFQWSDAANWSNGVPVSDSTTEITFTPNITSGATVVADNDIGAFTLNKLTFTHPSNQVPSFTTITVSGSPLTFTSNGATLPIIGFLKSPVSGVGVPVYNIQNNLVLNTNTAIALPTGSYKAYANFLGSISGPGRLTVGTNSSGTSQLSLLASNSYAGGTTIKSSYFVKIHDDSALGLVPSAATPSNLVFDGGSLCSTGGVVTINSNRGIYVAGGGVTFCQVGGALIYNGVIEGPGEVTISTGVLTLGGTNTYTGLTTIDGTLNVPSITRLGQAGGLGAPTTEAKGRITFSNGGILNYTGPGASTDRKIGLVNVNRIYNNGTGMLNFTNTAADAFTYSSPNTLFLGGSGPGGLIAGSITCSFAAGVYLMSDNAGTWVLTGTNTYSIKTQIGGGVLQADDGIGLSTNSQLSYMASTASGTGGVLQNNGTAYTFTRSVGTNVNQISWGGPASIGASPGGFAAKGAKFIVNLGGSGAMLTWGATPYFVGWSNQVRELVFGSTTADNVIEFQNSINLSNATRTLQVNDNTNSLNDIAVLSGVLTNGALTKTGAGVLHLDGANTYTGRTTVSAGYIGGNGSLAGSLVISNGAGLQGVTGKTLHVASNVTLNATSILSEPGLPAGGVHIVLTYGGTLTGSFGVTNLPAGTAVNYGTRTNSQITLSGPRAGAVIVVR